MFKSSNQSTIAKTAGISLSLCLLLHLGTPPAANAQSNSNSMNSGSQTNNGALGLVVNWNQQGRLVVTKVVAGGPAEKAGVSVGDRLFSIDGQNIDGLPVETVFSRILGAVGTTVVMNLSSPSKGNYQASITRVSIDSLNSASFNVGWQPANDASSGASTASTANGANSGTANNNFSTTSAAIPASTAGGVTWKTKGGGEAGYSLKYPDGWTVEQNNTTGRIDVKSPGNSNLSIFPFFLPDQSFDSNKAQGLFQAMLKQYAKGSDWSTPAVVGGGLRSMSTSNQLNSIAGLVLSSMNGGTTGSLIIFQVPNSPSAASDLATLSQILQTFNITGAASQNAKAGGQGGGDSSGGAARDQGSDNIGTATQPSQNIQFTSFVDPNFNAFSLDVPVGWDVSGGMKRPIPIDLRPWVKAVSPDQKAIVFIGDGSIEPRYLPANWLTWLGCPPGSTYKGSNGLVSKVLYYEPAEKFVKKYAESKFGKGCESFELVNVEQHPDLARTVNGTQGVLASDASSVKYNFRIQGYEGEAYFLAVTKKSQTMWWVSQICGVVAAKGCEKQALDVFLQMYKSWQYNPQWSQAQNAQNIQSTQNWIATDRAVRARSAAAFQSRMATMDARHNAFRSRMADMDASHAKYMNSTRSSDRAHSNFINYIHDEDTLMNPTTGTKYQVQYGPKYHWVNSTGDGVLGTNSAWSPGANWTELVTPPR
ncbi:MAG: PDZ domain-containing protein [Candidatus Melainabacteria bacterium]|nr:PDZ domain-containing protein [Candidatus Melainabacteria bacterium]